jgi:hypothetical protein
MKSHSENSSAKALNISVFTRFKIIGKAILLSLTLGFVLLESSASESYKGNEEKYPNVIIIFCDDLGFGDIEPFGAQQHRTPNLLTMAAEGMKFTDFYVSSGVCTPSRSVL